MLIMTPSEAHRYCTEKTKNSGSNFYYSFLFLARERREAMYTVYTFCHEVDDAVDHPSPNTNPEKQIALWREEVTALYQGSPHFPVTISLAEHVHKLDIPETYLQELLSGMEMDVTTQRYETFEALSLYCYRVASVVGLICLKVFGTKSLEAEDYAMNLGMAFQLTNILRDVGADADRNRIYIPLEDLSKFGYSEQQLREKQYSPDFQELMRFQCSRAHDYYDKAQEIFHALPKEDQKSLVAAEIMRAVYFRILLRIESLQYQVFGPRISLAPSKRFLLAIYTWLRSSLSV